MEAKIRIVEISPKLKLLKNNPKDIISISFISDNYSLKIEDVEKAINSNDKFIINLKESKNIKNKNIIQSIKYSLIRNNNYIIGTGEFTPSEGIKWYKLNEINNNISKESLITSSTSNGNFKNNNATVSRRTHNLSDSHNSYPKEPLNSILSKNNINQVNNSSVLTTIKIKISINIYNKKMINKKDNCNNNHYNSIINNNYTKEPSENSSKYDEILFDKEKDIFNEVDLTITELDMSKLNTKPKLTTVSKKINNEKIISTGIHSKKFLTKNNFNSNHIQAEPGANILGENPINNKIISNTIYNCKVTSPKRKVNNLTNKKLFNEDIRMKTSINFNIRRNLDNKEIINDNKCLNKNNNDIRRKINSCENIEDEILDQNFKNYLKNDEILKANLSINNSFNNITQNNNNNNNNSIKVSQNYQNTYVSNNNEFFPQTARSKILGEHINSIQNKRVSSQNLNTNNLYSDVQLLKTNSEFDCVITETISKNLITNNENNNLETNIGIINTNENFERLKTDFLLLYSKDNINKINNDFLFLEIQLMIEKILTLQDKHQKEYMDFFNIIKLNKRLFNYYQNKYILLVKKMNKLHAKKLYNDIKHKKNELYNDNINNFIKIRSKIMNKGEFIIWKKMMEKASKSHAIYNNKNKMINIFLTLCEKNENILNKLSFKFYKEIKNKYIKNNPNNNNNIKKPHKLNSNSNFSERKTGNIKMRIKDNETELNMPYLRTNNNMKQNINRLNSNKNKYAIFSKKNMTKMNLNKDDYHAKNNNINFGTVINENISHNNNHRGKKINNYKNKSSSIGDKVFHKKRGANKSQ